MKVVIRLPVNTLGHLSNFYQYLVVQYICIFIVGRISPSTVANIFHGGMESRCCRRSGCDGYLVAMQAAGLPMVSLNHPFVWTHRRLSTIVIVARTAKPIARLMSHQSVDNTKSSKRVEYWTESQRQRLSNMAVHFISFPRVPSSRHLPLRHQQGLQSVRLRHLLHLAYILLLQVLVTRLPLFVVVLLA